MRVRNHFCRVIRPVCSKLALCLVLSLATAAFGKELRQYQRAQRLQIDSVPCGTAENDNQSFVGQMLGTDSGSKVDAGSSVPECVLEA
jgi:hypothetical protein